MFCDCFSIGIVQEFEEKSNTEKRMGDAKLKTRRRLQNRYWEIGYTMEGVVFKKEPDDSWTDQVFCLRCKP